MKLIDQRLTPENFEKGFLIDEELIAGIHREEAQFVAYVLRHTTGEYLGIDSYSTIDEAVAAIDRMPRNWTFETLGGCKGTRCAEGQCKGESCRHY